MRKQELYNILIDGKLVFSSLTQMEMFDRLEDLSIEYYQTGTPNPNSIKTQIVKE